MVILTEIYKEWGEASFMSGSKTYDELMKSVKTYIENDNELLNTVPLILQDDGMGYGAINGKMTDFYHSGDKKGNDEIHIWF